MACEGLGKRVHEFEQSAPWQEIVNSNARLTRLPALAHFERNDSITMSAPIDRVNFGGANQTKGLGGKEPNMLIIVVHDPAAHNEG